MPSEDTPTIMDSVDEEPLFPVIEEEKTEPKVDEPVDNEPPAEPDKEPETKEWDKNRQMRDELAAERRKREEAEKVSLEATQKLTEALSTMADKVAGIQTPAEGKEDPKEKLLSEIEGISITGDIDEDTDALRKMKDTLKRVALLNVDGPAASDVGSSHVIKDLEAKLAALEARQMVAEGKSATSATLSALDKQYGEQHRTAAVEKAITLINQLPEGTPDDAVKGIYEMCYKAEKAMEPSNKQDLPNIPTDPGTGGTGVDGSKPLPKNVTQEEYLATFKQRAAALSQNGTGSQ